MKITMFHGTHEKVAGFSSEKGKVLFLTSDPNAARAYGRYVHSVEFSTEHDIGTEDDILEAATEAGCDLDEESRAWGFLDHKRCVAVLERRFDAVEGQDCLPGTDGSDPSDRHDFLAVFGAGKVCRVVSVVDTGA